MTDTVLARLAALKTTPTPELRKQWRDLFDKDPPLYNRRYLETRLAYRIQELAYGGLKPETVERLVQMGEQLARGESITGFDEHRPISGTQLIREWHGVEYRVTVRDFDYEWEGRPYRSLSSVARAITGVRWNGKVFFGLKNQRGRR
jgi:hypothetical protein